MPEADDEAWWSRLIQDRDDAVKEIERLVRSRNRWATKYNNLLSKTKERRAKAALEG